jgi:hypothetical protein
MFRARLLSVILAAALAACSSSTAPSGGDPEGDLDVEFRNFTATSAVMGETGKSTITVVGNGSDGNPTIYRVVSPGLGGSLSFTAEWSGQSQTVSCTVTDVTGVSVPPSVVIQPFGSPGFLDCSGW